MKPLFSIQVIEYRYLGDDQWFIYRYPLPDGPATLYVSPAIMAALRDGRYEDLPDSPPIDIRRDIEAKR